MPRTNVVGTTAPPGSGAQRCALAGEREHTSESAPATAKLTPEAANNLLKVLRVLLQHAVEIGMVTSNPTIGVKGYRNGSDGILIWKETEVAQFEATHPIGTKPASGAGGERSRHAAQARKGERSWTTHLKKQAADVGP